ncbi:hypothetical protein [Novosphingobium sp. KN65.2]|uniref:hypothetical protein n=1 Tax=Novosphingobium sp. KN65.2 TaxID=1478134 RepID=UPI0005E1FF3A|nr:hypothetical protein [Novosphingobium sp. KN65.2]CDO34319.1 hypothetical protein SPHV1_1450012 [Novosphingobium sp. KN65.2]
MTTTDPLLSEVRRAMNRLGFTIAAQNLLLNWPRYDCNLRQRIAKKWGIENV